MANMENKRQEEKPAATNEHLAAIAEALGKEGSPTEYSFTDRDVILYNLGVGANRKELKYVFEGAEDFQTLPTFGVIPPFSAEMPFDYDAIVPNFSPMMLLHGEQYLEIRKFPLPTSGRLLSRGKLLEVIDKGSASIVKTGITTVNAENGEDVFYNEMTVFLRGAGGFDGQKKGQDRGAATAVNEPPKRAPDEVVESPTGEDQAAIYRLSGDYNPLHIDPGFAKMGGFKAPILHGLCTFGVAGKAVYDRFGAFRNVKVRFAGPVIPGQTIVTEMWREGKKIVFQCKVKETGKVCIAGAAAELA
ncbi:hypothetical protein TGAMA5MH_09394 [Trichoderma gamsii]|uniref:MaoC-like domain-containing protein n=1 Tax=Trichoderma gamsii TaxID=398673 RepID=A0A2K0SZG5_9HYPO|nr:hypothetical protein TGAMA5MH_09394 [Trichoderma gamsii]